MISNIFNLFLFFTFKNKHFRNNNLKFEIYKNMEIGIVISILSVKTNMFFTFPPISAHFKVDNSHYDCYHNESRNDNQDYPCFLTARKLSNILKIHKDLQLKSHQTTDLYPFKFLQSRSCNVSSVRHIFIYPRYMSNIK